MSLRLRALRLRADTADGAYGHDIRFDDGLVVVRAENSMGKTTAVNSILYALGMEGLIAQSQRVPLPPAMTSRLRAPDGGVVEVSESRVLLEVENHLGEILTFERYAKREGGDTRLVRVWRARRVTDPSPEDTFEDLLARVQGSGVGEVGVGPRLERFIGWDLPTIVMPDGGERRLYPELMMALVFVEQRAGWRGIQAAMPTYGIPDVRKRAREYLLSLDAYQRQRRRLALRLEADEIRRAWSSSLALAGARLRAVGLRLIDVAHDVDPGFDDDSPLRARDVSSGRTLDVELTAVAEALADAGDEPDKSREPATLDADELRLRELDEKLQAANFDVRERERLLVLLRSERSDLNDQERRLREDLTRNQDAQRLQRFGGQTWADEERDCPTCHQALPATLLGTLDRPSMTIEQNVAYIRQQLEIVQAARHRADAEMELRVDEQAAARRAVAEIRMQVRAVRDALVRPAGAPVGRRHPAPPRVRTSPRRPRGRRNRGRGATRRAACDRPPGA